MKNASSFRQADIAEATGLNQMAVSRAIRSIGGLEHPLSLHSAVLVTTASALRDFGISFPEATRLVGRFQDEVRYVAADPDERKCWIVYVRRGAVEFPVSCHTNSHLGAVLESTRLARVLALHEAVRASVELLNALKGKMAA